MPDANHTYGINSRERLSIVIVRTAILIKSNLLKTPFVPNVSIMDFLDRVELASNEVFNPIYPGKRKIDSKKIENAPIINTIKRELLDIFKETSYFDWNSTVNGIEKSILQALHFFDGNFYIALNTNKISSEVLFVCRFWKLLKNRCLGLVEIQKYVDEEYSIFEKAGINILIIDDFILTGHNIGVTLDVLSNRGKNNIYICVCAVSDRVLGKLKRGERKITFEKRYKNVKTFLQLTIPEYNEDEYGSTPDLARLLNIGYSPSDDEDPETSLIPFFSDHKISNIMTNIPYVFHYGKIGDVELGCLIEYPPDEYIKKNLWEKYFKDIVPEPKLFNYGGV